MNVLILILLGLFALFGFSSGSSSGVSQECMVTSDGIESCGPITDEAGLFQLPVAGPVVSVTSNNGPLPPEFQAGYDLVIEADGSTTITVSPEGSLAEVESERTAEQTIRTEAIGSDGVNEALVDLKECGYFGLPQRGSFDGEDLAVGGRVDVIEVQLADGSWSVSADPLTAEQAATFESCQTALEERFAIDPPA